ncbi:MAG: hypothetical protein C0478_11595 [Planctomyces sp.]|nr:hypothetical protein [Planctomyces sp.]
MGEELGVPSAAPEVGWVAEGCVAEDGVAEEWVADDKPVAGGAAGRLQAMVRETRLLDRAHSRIPLERFIGNILYSAFESL